MRYAIDAEFIDTPTCSALISFAIVDENLDARYFEFNYPSNEITPWLAENVIPHLNGHCVSYEEAARQLNSFIRGPTAEIWAYVGAYDWYWFCRIFGGWMHKPPAVGWTYKEMGFVTEHLESTVVPEHHALNDALSTMVQLKKLLAKSPV